MYARSKAGAGFTIVETMIFLGISALMFVLAIGAMSGKQQQTEFDTSVGTLKSELNQVLSDVSVGNFIDQINGNYASCSGASGRPVISLSAAITNPDGTCTAIGEIIEFGSGSNGQLFYSVPVFGCNYMNCNSTNVATDISSSLPRIKPSVYQSTNMPFGLTIDNSHINPPGAFGIFSFTSFNSNSNGLSSGSGHVELFQIPNVPYSSSNTPSTLVSPINNNGLIDCSAPLTDSICINPPNTDPEPINPSSGVSFCVDSGTSNNQSAEFTLGGSNSTTAVSDKIYTGSGCT
ncbi:MAG: pilus assembly FimT family protein [Candidatus Saccharimonadales bacterium]